MRHFPNGDPIRVRTDDDRPVVFTWHGEPHHIDSVEDVRETRLDWWAPTGEIHRLYYLVTTNHGLICEIYRDIPAGAWFMARIFD